MKSPLILAAALLCTGAALAKLPPLSDEAKAKAAEAAAKTAHGAKVESFKLCKSMERVVAHYQAESKKAGKAAPAPTATAACADPGAFVYTPPAPAPPAAVAAAPAPAAPAPKK
ncbi:hypothetical protein ACPOLB_09775 [Rubrivivax sp. RP6-9]|uniref:hypothetical protein n=1 Tax=Rubrivivax sp. RP6-9 TaxID=3415750 RepID=UPI003CC6B1E8